jgi:hypothetical protein
MNAMTRSTHRLKQLLIGGCVALLSAQASAAIIGVEFLGAGDRGVNPNPSAWTMTGFGFTANRVFWELSGHGTPVSAGALDPSILFSTFRLTTSRSISGVQATGCFEAFSGPCGQFGNDPFLNTATVGAGVEFAGRFGGSANDFDPNGGDVGVSGNTLDINPTSMVVHLDKVFGRDPNGSSGTVNVNAEVCFIFSVNDCVGRRSASLPLSTNPQQGTTTAPTAVSDGGQAALAMTLGAALLASRRRKA